MKRMHFPRSMYVPPALKETVQHRNIKNKYALLVNPFYPKDPHSSFGKHVLTPSIALTSVAASTPHDWEVGFWDENLLQGPPPVDPLPKVVGITVHLTFARRAYELANWYRMQGAIIVFGGLHLVACSEEAKPHADILAIGDGVALWPAILKDIESGKYRSTYSADFDGDYDTEPMPRRNILPRESFLTTTSLVATRGCSNRCGFCYLSTDGLRMPCRSREPQQVVDEIIEDDQPYSVFVDNNLGARPEYLRSLCAKLQPLERIWSAAVSIDVTNDPALVQSMARAGCTGVFVGLESLNDQNLQHAGKRAPTSADYSRRVQIFHNNGIQVNGSFVFGFDHDRPDVFERTADWIEENKLECATFHILTPYPGTPQFRQLEKEGRLFHKNWDLYDTSHVVFKPKHMSPEQLESGYRYCYERLFSLKSIWKRRPAERRAVIPYLAMSILYKKCNRLWPIIIKRNWTARFWRPLIEISRKRHVRARTRFEVDLKTASTNLQSQPSI